MKMLKTVIGTLALCSAFALPAAASAATTTTTTTSPPPVKPIIISSVTQTNVNGVLVPGIYLIDENSRAAYIPGGVGLVVVNKDTALPIGAYYVKS